MKAKHYLGAVLGGFALAFFWVMPVQAAPVSSHTTSLKAAVDTNSIVQETTWGYRHRYYYGGYYPYDYSYRPYSSYYYGYPAYGRYHYGPRHDYGYPAYGRYHYGYRHDYGYRGYYRRW